MTDSEFKEMLAILERLVELIDKYECEVKERGAEEPFLIPSDVYDKICDKIKQANITLFGVS
jgi:hypothetical protein